MILKKNNVMILIMLMVGTVLFWEPVFGEIPEKMELQRETLEVLDQLDRIILKSKSLNTLFTDQSKENLDMYEAQYCLISTLVEWMDEVQKKWESRIKRDRNDKNYRVFLATVQLAMYSIYSRPERYMGFMKVFKKAKREVKCFKFLKKFYEEMTLKEDLDDATLKELKSDENKDNREYDPNHLVNWVKHKYDHTKKKKGYLSDNDQNVLTYRDKADDWEIKAASILDKAKENIQKALSLDRDFVDALILEVQVLVMEEKYSEAHDCFVKLEAIDLFKEKRSLLYSWKAFTYLMEGKQELGKSKLRTASAYSEPLINSEWSLEYLRLFKRAQSKWVVFNFHDIDLLKEGNLEELRDKSFESIIQLLKVMERPASGLPRRVDSSKLKRLSRGHRKLFYTLDSDSSRRNLKKFAIFFEDLHEQGNELVKSFEKWDELAKKNDYDAAFFYLLNKANCAFVLYYMLENTIGLLDNELLVIKLNNRQRKSKARKKIDFPKQWNKWLAMVKGALTDDMNTLRKIGGNSIYFLILDFEYQAFFGDVDVAMQKLEALAQLFEMQDRRELQINSSENKMSVNTFINSWKSCLFFLKGEYDAAEEILEEVERSDLIRQWMDNQENLIFIKSQPVQQSLPGNNAPKSTLEQ
jgi:hypothetical protein